MSKRLEVVFQDKEYSELLSFCKIQKLTISGFVREVVRNSMSLSLKDTKARLSRIMRFTKFSYPTVEMDEILSDISIGRNLKLFE